MQKRENQQGVKRRQNGRVQIRVRAICCIVASLILYGSLSALPGEEALVEPDGSIRREGYGGDDRQYQLYVDGILKEPFPLTVEVGARRYTNDGAEQAFRQIMDGMEERIRGENPSLKEVRTSLSLPTWLEEYGVRLCWTSSNPELLDSFGQIQDGAADMQEGVPVSLGVQLAAGEFRREYELPVRILPQIRDPQQVLTDGLAREIRPARRGLADRRFPSSS